MELTTECCRSTVQPSWSSWAHTRPPGHSGEGEGGGALVVLRAVRVPPLRGRRRALAQVVVREGRQVRGAHLERALVQVEQRRVQAVHDAALLVAHAQKRKARGHLLRDERKVLGRHGQVGQRHAALAHHALGHAARKVRHGRVVDERREVGLLVLAEVDDALAAVHARLHGHHLGQPLLQLAHDVVAERAHRAAKAHRVGHHVERLAVAGHVAHVDHHGLVGRQVRGHQRLELRHNGGRRDDWVDGGVRHGSMAAPPLHCRLKRQHARHEGARPRGDGPSGQLRPHVQRKGRINIRHHPLCHHHLAAPVCLLSRLEQQLDAPARQLALARLEQRGRAQQHGAVRVVAARVHAAGVRAAVGRARELRDGQRVHVGAQRHAGRPGRAAAQVRHYASPCHWVIIANAQFV
mmetsp:Transcript_8406/g.20972  ORF Transcript_8406/g.20972 Transcript_8406/m.20972 type:complete len:408 (-) Transcript_8406:441-1664(-)